MLEQFTIRRAIPADAPGIVQLYQDAYQGTYPDPLMRDTYLLSRALNSDEFCWIIGAEGATVIASVAYRRDPVNRIAKSFGAVVDPRYRKSKIAKNLMEYGVEILLGEDPPVELIYATTRTVSAAPQRLAASLGYKRLGLFPNVHKTEVYETHCLASWFAEGTLAKRETNFKQHPKVAPLFEICSIECDLPSIETADEQTLWDLMAGEDSAIPLELEVISAPKFVQHRFKRAKDEAPDQEHWFFPFHVPNIVLTSPEQSVEVFAFISEADKHCVIIALRDLENRGFSTVLEAATKTLYNRLGARYLEFIIRADELAKIDTAIDLHFIPSAYFPALQLQGDKRLDYVAFSRSFEMLDFRTIELEGINQRYLLQYFKTWKEISLNRLLMME
jgi:RimJ/RimL family protein N-acetyltransferase